MNRSRLRTVLVAACVIAITVVVILNGPNPGDHAAAPPQPTPVGTEPLAPAASCPRAPEKAILLDGRAIAPSGAPQRVQDAITVGNQIAGKPYRLGGGHRPFENGVDATYDGPGAVSRVLGAARLISAPLDQIGLARWGIQVPPDTRAHWITVYSGRLGTWMCVAGLRLDADSTSGVHWSVGARAGAYARRCFSAGPRSEDEPAVCDL
jgi:hypothetical protein